MNRTLILQLKNLPGRPGVYQFFNSQNKVLYVGKAKQLKNRVRSYFQKKSQLTPAKQEMVPQISYLKTTVVDNEDEALLLESALIKQHQPPYNIIFKDDKNWLYLSINYHEEFPRVELARRSRKKNKWFGPYTSANNIRQTFKVLKKILGLRTCTNPPNRPCFDSSLGRCLGHNLNPSSKNTYLDKLKQLEQFLKGHSRAVKDKLGMTMQRLAKQKRFEQAARLRDNIKLLDRVLSKQKIISTRRESFDVINLASQNNLTAICRLPIRQGVLLENDQVLIEHDKKLATADILANFIERYYPQVTDKPKKLFLPLPVSLTNDIKMAIPQRGYKRHLSQLAHANAANYLNNSLASWQKQASRAKKGLEELKWTLNLKTLPQRIEGYDISNIQGQHAVGAMVVLTNGLVDKSQYRKFIIKRVTGPNDVAMLAEVLVRRFKRKHQGWPKPNLIMLDGGLPQLNTVARVFKNKKITIPLVALAKKEELLFSPNQSHPIRLPANAPGLLLLEQLRDEAHRFGITFYRSRHRKAAVS